MTSTDLLLGIVLDKSGSMGSLRQVTADGVNHLLRDQADQPGRCLVSLTLFDSTFDVRQVAVDARDFPALGSPENPYTTGGNTALYDAVGTTVKGIEAWLAGHPDFAGAVKIAIFTDGHENASRQWHILEPRGIEDVWDLNNLIEWKQGEGWEFLFLGAGGAAWTESHKFTSISRAAVFNYEATPDMALAVMGNVSETFATTRSTGKSFAAAAVDNDVLLSVNAAQNESNGS